MNKKRMELKKKVKKRLETVLDFCADNKLEKGELEELETLQVD